MPYVPANRRAEMANGDLPRNAGDVNYLMTLEIITKWIAKPCYATLQTLDEEYTDPTVRCPYATINQKTFIKSRERAFKEFDRRIGGPYEDGAIRRNGDCYPVEAWVCAGLTTNKLMLGQTTDLTTKEKRGK